MKKLRIAIVLVLSLATFASAANFNLVLTPAQVAAIQYGYSVAPDRATYPTVNEWFAAQVSGVLINSYAAAQAQVKAGTFCTRFKAASQASQDSICSNLGLAAGCDPCDK